MLWSEEPRSFGVYYIKFFIGSKVCEMFLEFSGMFRGSNLSSKTCMNNNNIDYGKKKQHTKKQGSLCLAQAQTRIIKCRFLGRDSNRRQGEKNYHLCCVRIHGSPLIITKAWQPEASLIWAFTQPDPLSTMTKWFWSILFRSSVLLSCVGGRNNLQTR